MLFVNIPEIGDSGANGDGAEMSKNENLCSSCSKKKISFCPLRWEQDKTPSCGFPPKPFPPAGPHGFRGHLRRSGMRASEDGASAAPPCYAACNAPASRSDGALPTHSRPALGTHTVAAALKRATPCERLVSGSTPNEITACLRTSRSCCSLFRL